MNLQNDIKIKNEAEFYLVGYNALCKPFNGLQGMRSQMTQLSITTFVRTSNPTKINYIKFISRKGMDNEKTKLPQCTGNPP
jgi:hypothetical protein